MKRGTIYLMLLAMLAQTAGAGARDILLIDDLSGGFGPAVTLLQAQGHQVTQVMNESLDYAVVSNASLLSNYDFVVYSTRNSDFVPDAAISALETYIQSGGDLLITGIGRPFGYTADPDLADLVRSFIYASSDKSPFKQVTVSNVDNFITNGPFGDFRGQALSQSSVQGGFVNANTGLGTVKLASGTSGVQDKAIFTDLPGSGGSVGAWASMTSSGVFAEPDFMNGGVYQNMFLNWAAGGTTTHTEVTPQEFSTEGHSQDSQVYIDLYFGNPLEVDGLSSIGTVGPLAVKGTANLVSTLDPLGNGSMATTGAELMFENQTNLLVDLGGLGTLSVDLIDVGLYLGHEPIPVTDTEFDLADTAYYALGLTQGKMVVHGATGLVADLLAGQFPLNFEFSGDPHMGGSHPSIPLPYGRLNGTIDAGAGLFVPDAEVNFLFQELVTPIHRVPTLGLIWGAVRGDVHLTAVPEPSSVVLAGLAALLIGPWVRRRIVSRQMAA